MPEGGGWIFRGFLIASRDTRTLRSTVNVVCSEWPGLEPPMHPQVLRRMRSHIRFQLAHVDRGGLLRRALGPTGPRLADRQHVPAVVAAVEEERVHARAGALHHLRRAGER